MRESLVACASIHGNTKKAAELLAEKLKATRRKGCIYRPLQGMIWQRLLRDAFRYG